MSLEGSPPDLGAPSSGSRRWIAAVGVAVGVALVVLWLFVGAERLPPVMSATLEHRAALGGRDAEACLSCHARGSARARPAAHTGRQDCWGCHGVGGLRE